LQKPRAPLFWRNPLMTKFRSDMTPAEAIRRAESIVLKDYQTFSTSEAREIMAGLLKALDEKALEAK